MEIDYNEAIEFIPTAGQIMEMEPPPIKWLVKPYLIEGERHLLTGFSGNMKSFFALWLARQATEKGHKVLYVDLEMGKVTAITRIQLLKFPSVTNFLYWGDWIGIKEEHRPPTTFAAKILTKFAEQGYLIIFDTLTEFHEADENVSGEMNVVNRQIANLQRKGATTMVLQQLGHDHDRKARGSTQIQAGYDACIRIKDKFDIDDKPDRPVIQIEWFKARLLGSSPKCFIFDNQSGNFIEFDKGKSGLITAGKARFESLEKERKVAQKIHQWLLTCDGSQSISRIQEKFHLAEDTARSVMSTYTNIYWGKKVTASNKFLFWGINST